MARLAAVRFLLALATLSFGLAGCGAAEPGADDASTVRRASERPARAGTARFALRYVERKGEGSCQGEVNYSAKRYRVLCGHAESRAREYEIELVRAGDDYYVRYEGDEAPFGNDPDKPWVRLGGQYDEDFFDVLDPAALLELLRSATRTTEHVGAAEVRGVATERFRLTIDRRLAQELTEGEEGPETFPVDVWIGADGVVRRMHTDDPPGTSVTLEFFDFGAPLVIEAPPPDQVADEDELEIEDVEPEECPGGPTAPLTEDAVKRTLGDHGVALDRMPSGCAAEEDVVVTLTNVLAGGRQGNGAAGLDALVVCTLSTRPAEGAALALHSYAEDSRTTFTLANLRCSLYPEGERAEADLRRLEQGLRALERTLR